QQNRNSQQSNFIYSDLDFPGIKITPELLNCKDIFVFTAIYVKVENFPNFTYTVILVQQDILKIYY
ncbi:hypothetical protein BpHYR1_051344, partial [Brachionus plicatilis]